MKKILLAFVLISLVSIAGSSRSQRKLVDATKGTSAYKTKIASDKNDVLKLENGAILEIKTGYLGYVGYRKDCVIYLDGYGVKVWIEGKRIYSCDVLKAPTEPYLSRPLPARRATMSRIKDEILIMSDGSIMKWIALIPSIQFSGWNMRMF